MPEILTESFCERCGTRYTFESSVPRAHRLGRFKTISRGLKNFVMSDDTSLDEALAAARSDEEREATSQQLDAFHKTFNFCMTCRQYTCANCWNEAEGRCLTCSPHLGHEVLPAPFPTLDPSADLAFDPAAARATNGHAAPAFDEVAWPTADLPHEPEAEAAPAELPEPVAAEPEPIAAELLEPVAAELPEPVTAEPEPIAAEAPPEPIAIAAEHEPAPTDAPAEREPLAAPPQAPVQPVAPSQPRPVRPGTVEEKAAAAAAQTAALLARFRPGQSIDEALDAYEAAVAEAATEAPKAVAPAPVPPSEPAPSPAPAPAPPVEPAPAAEPAAAEDRVEQPAWRLVAPDTPLRAADGHPAETPPAPTPRAPEAPQWPDTPQWPATPQWPPRPASPPAADNVAFLPRARGGEDLWTASSRDLMAATPATGAPTGGVQSCVSCGLSLSATARFCRRCGTRQGS